jgi:hypothetical protein
MAVEFETHQCKHVACKCNANAEGEFCDSFCEDVETSEDDKKCGCGHMACDATKQMGNESTFDATGS